MKSHEGFVRLALRAMNEEFYIGFLMFPEATQLLNLALLERHYVPAESLL